jgi:hypothetical protein
MAAQLVGCGKTTVPNSGTPVQVSVPAAIAGPGSPGLSSAHALLIQALSTNLGKVYIGVAGLSKATLANCLVVLPIPTVNLLPTFSISLTTAANALSLSDLWIDADNAGEGVLISAVLA